MFMPCLRSHWELLYVTKKHILVVEHDLSVAMKVNFLV